MITTCFWVFALVGVGMGFVSLATVLVVQNSLEASDLGVATSSHQFSRNLGSTVGIGICGGVFTTGFSNKLEAMVANSPVGNLPESLASQILSNSDSVLQPEVRAQFPPDTLPLLYQSVAHGTLLVFWATFVAAITCMMCCLLLPRD
jgi:hypothetical protein